MKFLCLCCPFCFEILMLCSLKALNPKNFLNAKEIQRKTDGGWLVSDPTRKHDDFCGLLFGVVHRGRLKPNLRPCSEICYEIVWNSLMMISKLSRLNFWAGKKSEQSTNLAGVLVHTSSPDTCTHKILPRKVIPHLFPTWSPLTLGKNLRFPILSTMPPFYPQNVVIFVCFGAPNPLMNLPCKNSHGERTSQSLVKPPLITGKLKLPLFCWKPLTPNQLGVFATKTKTLHVFLGVLGGGKSAWFSLTSWGSWRLALLMAKLQRDVWRKQLEGQAMDKKRRLQRGLKPRVFGGVVCFLKKWNRKDGILCIPRLNCFAGFLAINCSFKYIYGYCTFTLSVLCKN